MQQGQYGKSITYFQNFLKNFSGLTSNKDAYLKIALAYKFQGIQSKYKQYLELAQKSEANQSEVDKNAQKIIDSIESVNENMLQIRFAIDGGFYQEAWTLIKNLSTSDLNELELIELEYRIARMEQLNGLTERAIESYRTVISSSELIEETYFAPNSYLQLGYIQRVLGNDIMAKTYFERVLSFKNHPYKTSLDSKAKVALNLLDDSNN